MFCKTLVDKMASDQGDREIADPATPPPFKKCRTQTRADGTEQAAELEREFQKRIKFVSIHCDSWSKRPQSETAQPERPHRVTKSNFFIVSTVSSPSINLWLTKLASNYTCQTSNYRTKPQNTRNCCKLKIHSGQEPASLKIIQSKFKFFEQFVLL